MDISTINPNFIGVVFTTLLSKSHIVPTVKTRPGTATAAELPGVIQQFFG
jgi:hypothetical protein